MTVGLSMITNDAKATIRILEKYGRYFDKWFITVADKDKKQHELLRAGLVDEEKLVLTYFKWNDNFGKARLFNQKQIDTDYFFWMDSDDELEDADRIPEVLRYMEANGLDMVQLVYKYAKNDLQEDIAVQWRERFVRTDSGLKWADVPVHETILAPYARYAQLNWVTVVHDKDEASIQKSYERNFKLLKKHYVATKDPRDAYYLGNHYFHLEEYQNAIEMYLNHIQASGWDEERYRSWCQIAVCEHKLGLHAKALSATNAATDERPDWPDAYFIKGMIYDEMEQPEKCLEWVKVGLSKPIPKTSSFLDPTLYQYQGLMQGAIASLKLGLVKEGFQYFKMVEEVNPTHPQVVQLKPLFEEAFYDQKATEYVKYLLHYTKGEGGKPLKLFEALPPRLYADPRLNAERANFLPRRKWEKGSIAYFCGAAAETWGPDTLDKGMGGSEEAVVYLSRELAKLGHEVTVFNDREEVWYDNIIGGSDVVYQPWTLLNPNDEFDIFVAWRAPENCAGVKARLKFVDLHDVVEPERVYSAAEYVDKFFVKSQYHRSLYPELPDDKFVVIGNGIVKEHFDVQD